MRPLTATTALLATLLALSGTARAGWSAPRLLSRAHASPYALTTDAVDARGDAAVAWETVGRWPRSSHGRRCAPSPAREGCFPVSTVHLAVRGADGRVIERTPWSSRIEPTMQLSLVLGAGRATLAWGYWSTAGSAIVTARLASGPLFGRWRSSRVLARFRPALPFGGYPQLAIAPSGELLATWEACLTEAGCPTGRTALFVARRRSGGGQFDAPQLVAGAPRGALAQFDARGTAYLSSSCSGRVLIAPPGSRRFGRAVTLTRGPVSQLTLSLAGAGRGLAAWVAGECSYDEAVPDTPGPVLYSALRAGAFSPPRTLTSPTAQAFYSSAVGVDGGGVVSWAAYEAAAAFAVFSAPIGADGLAEATQHGASAIIAVCADAGGDLVYSRPPGSGPTPSEVFVRRAGGADEPAPAASGAVAAAPFGRAIALAYYPNAATLELSLWRP